MMPPKTVCQQAIDIIYHKQENTYRGKTPTDITLPLSKSISNRLLIINAIAGIKTMRNSVAFCDDTEAMFNALATEDTSYINIGAAGTAMRFLTAYFASTPGYDVTLDGSERMRRRPIGILVEALRQAGASIDYTGVEGYPPLHIKGRKLKGGSIVIDSNISSQYTSALLMVAPTMTDGLKLTLKGKTVSLDYIGMTIAMMRDHGITADMNHTPTQDLMIKVSAGLYHHSSYPFRVEADWSAASYWYEVSALTGLSFCLKGLTLPSLQGDSALCEIFKPLGVMTMTQDGNIVLTNNKQTIDLSTVFIIDMKSCPDIAQTVAATCCGLGKPFVITGLSTLPIKETDRLEAMRLELLKIGYIVRVSDGDTLSWNGERCFPEKDIIIETYNDHRMAMSMAPLAAVAGKITIENPDVVTKSYPDFWEHLRKAQYKTVTVS